MIVTLHEYASLALADTSHQWDCGTISSWVLYMRYDYTIVKESMFKGKNIEISSILKK